MLGDHSHDLVPLILGLHAVKNTPAKTRASTEADGMSQNKSWMVIIVSTL